MRIALLALVLAACSTPAPSDAGPSDAGPPACGLWTSTAVRVTWASHDCPSNPAITLSGDANMFPAFGFASATGASAGGACTGTTDGPPDTCDSAWDMSVVCRGGTGATALTLAVDAHWTRDATGAWTSSDLHATLTTRDLTCQATASTAVLHETGTP